MYAFFRVTVPKFADKQYSDGQINEVRGQPLISFISPAEYIT